MLGFEQEDVVPDGRREETSVIFAPCSVGRQAGDPVLHEPLDARGERLGGDAELGGARFDLLTEHGDRSNLLVGDLVGMEQSRLERQPLR